MEEWTVGLPGERAEIAGCKPYLPLLGVSLPIWLAVIDLTGFQAMSQLR